MYYRVLSEVMTPVKLPCPTCRKGTLEPAPQVVRYRGVRLGRFVVETCTACGTEVVDERNGRAIDRAFAEARAEGKVGQVKRPSKAARAAPRRATAGPTEASRGFRSRRVR